MEIPQEVNVQAAKLAKEAGKTVIVDMGGSDEPLDPRLYELSDYLSPNEHEVKKLKCSPEQLLKEYPNIKILLKRGSEGSRMMTKDKCIDVPACSFKKHPNLKLVDTTCAGDTFTAGFAVGLIEFDGDEKKAMELGTKAAFLTITRMGASTSVPTRTELDATIKN